MHNEERFFPLEANMMMDLTGHANDCCVVLVCSRAPGEKLLMLTRCHISAGMEGKAKRRGRERRREKADLFFVLFATYAYIVLSM